MTTATFPLARFRELVRSAGRTGFPVVGPLEEIPGRTGSRWLWTQNPTPGGRRYGIVVLASTPVGPSLPTDVCIAVGRGPLEGAAWAWVRGPAGPAPLGGIRLVGPGMPALDLAGRNPVDGGGERWSRSEAALGAGVWARLRRMRYCIVGAGRTGSILAEAVVRGWGRPRVRLVDPDEVEPHNLGESAGLTRRDVGREKAAAVAGHLGGRVAPVPSSVARMAAGRAAAGADAMFSAVDNDGARAAAAVLAALLLRPHLDVATGIHGPPAARRMGADVRLTVPGEACLSCLGGLSDRAAAARSLGSAEGERDGAAGRDWRRERAGSLRSLNTVAVGVALRLWEDFVGGRLPGSAWVRAEFDRHGRLTVTHRVTTPGGCPLCRLAGRGWAGLAAAAGAVGAGE